METRDLEPPERGHHGRDLIILLWVFTGVTLVVVLLRGYTAFRRRQVALDDWLMFIAMLSFIGWSICATLMAVHGGVGHVYYLAMEGPEAVSLVVKLNWTTQIFGISGVSFGKISVAFLILRILGSAAGKLNKTVLYILVAVTFVVDSLAAIFTFVQCDPPRKLWEPETPGHCWPPSVMADYAVFTGVTNGVIDIALALFPAAAVFLRLRVPKRVKFELCALFSGGLFAGICSFIKSKQLLALSNRADFSWATYAIFIWVTLELFLVISLGSVPSLRQLGPQKRPSTAGLPYVFPQPNNLGRRLGYGDDSEGGAPETQRNTKAFTNTDSGCSTTAVEESSNDKADTNYQASQETGSEKDNP